MEKQSKRKGLEKLVPRVKSFLPGGLYFIGRKDFENKNLLGIKDKNILRKSSKGTGYCWEGLRDSFAILGALGGGIEGGIITYLTFTYLSDRISSTGFFPFIN